MSVPTEIYNWDEEGYPCQDDCWDCDFGNAECICGDFENHLTFDEDDDIDDDDDVYDVFL